MAIDNANNSTAPERMSSPIAKIEGNKVLGHFDYVVEFNTNETPNGDAVRVIYAENGMGKTNFLRAVYNLLLPQLENLQAVVDAPVGGVSVALANGSLVTFERLDAEGGSYRFSASGPDRAVEVLLSPDDFDNRSFRRMASRSDVAQYLMLLSQIVAPTVMVGDDRLVYSALEAPGSRFSNHAYESERQSLRSRQSRQTSNVRDSLDQVEKALTQSTFAGINRDRRTSPGVYLEITRQILAGTKQSLAAEARAALQSKAETLLEKADGYEKYGLISLQQVRDVVAEFEGTRANDSRFKQLHAVLDPYLTNLLEEVTALEPAQQLIDTFVTAVNGFLDRKELRFSTVRGIRLIGRNDEALDPDALSSGEKHLLLLLSNAVLARFEGSLVIIDEPELSLGLRWQRKLLTELRRCTAGSGVQFLIASHSVQIMNGVEDVVSPVEVG